MKNVWGKWEELWNKFSKLRKDIIKESDPITRCIVQNNHDQFSLFVHC